VVAVVSCLGVATSKKSETSCCSAGVFRGLRAGLPRWCRARFHREALRCPGSCLSRRVLRGSGRCRSSKSATRCMDRLVGAGADRACLDIGLVVSDLVVAEGDVHHHVVVVACRTAGRWSSAPRSRPGRCGPAASASDPRSAAAPFRSSAQYSKSG
jgi:hypothetical protein